MAVIPLTMCRLLIAHMSQTFINNFIPFSEMNKCHIAIGYMVIGLIFAAGAVLVMYFGIICNSGDKNFCQKLTSEIMITGYVILAVSKYVIRCYA